MAISISSKGYKLKDDLEHANVAGNSYLGSFNDAQRGALVEALAACIKALDPDRNGKLGNSFTMAASLTATSVTVSIS
jgi:hypothetical protein